jgi:hypothetical protein
VGTTPRSALANGVELDGRAGGRCRQTLIVPLENAAEAAVVEGVEVYGASSLPQLPDYRIPWCDHIRSRFNLMSRIGVTKENMPIAQ